MKNSLSIVVVNYNGRDLLKESIPTILEAADFSSLSWEIIVVDNASSDDSLTFLAKRYPNVITLPVERNNYWFSVNEGIRISSHHYLFLLNNDVKLERHSIRYLFDHFTKDNEGDLFAVTPQEMSWDGTIATKGAQGITVTKEIIMPSEKSFYFDRPCMTFNADNSMFSKEKLMRLGLFDPLFTPFWYEDVDIAYRAWKAGYRIIYEPQARIYHKSSTTINKYISLDDQKRYFYKNSLLFIWKDITDARLFLWLNFLSLLKLLKALFFLGSQRQVFLGFMMALGSLKRLKISRKKAIENFILSDRAVLSTLNTKKFYEEDHSLFDKSLAA